VFPLASTRKNLLRREHFNFLSYGCGGECKRERLRRESFVIKMPTIATEL
jgi:hypothetical protein